MSDTIARAIPISDIVPSPHNPRKRFEQAGLDELATSIKAQGIVQPLVARKNPWPDKEPYELISGERRLRAAKLAGLAKVPLIVVDKTDLEVLEIQVVENAQREDVHPLEEAGGYQSLKDAGLTVDQIAERIGKDRSHIFRRLQLLNLLKDGQDVFLRGDMTAKHALQLARLPESEQMRPFIYLMTDDWEAATKGKPRGKLGDRAKVPPRDLAHFIERNITRALSAAPWKKADAKLVPEAGACNTCEKRTGANPLLFDEVAKNERCMDGACFERKFAAHLVQVQEQAKAKGSELVPVSQSYSIADAEPNALPRNKYTEVYGEKCSSESKGLVMDGGNRGHIIRICNDPTCKLHHSSKVTDASRQQKAAEEKLKLERRYRRELWTAVSKEVKQPDIEDLRAVALYLWGRAWHDLVRDYCQARGIEPVEKKRSYGGMEKDYVAPVARAIEQMKTSKDLLCWMVSFTLYRDAHIQQYHEQKTADALHDAAARYGVDAKKIRAEIEAEATQKKQAKLENAKPKPPKRKAASV